MGLSPNAGDYQRDMDEHKCNACGSNDLITVTMTVDKQVVSFTACHNCEAKWWFRDGQRVALDSVLDIVAST
jgi:formate dehydrogenase maturation protein FdhE